MRPISGRAFERLLRTAAPAVFRQFVADLWSARGWQTTVEGPVLVATRDGGRTQRLLVRHPSEPHREAVAGEIDGVVTATADPPVTDDVPPGVRVFDATDLRDMLLYGMDRDVADELVRRRFGQALSTPRPGETPIGQRLRSSPAAVTKVVAVVAVVFLLASALLGGPGAVALTGNDGPVTAARSPGDEDRTPTFHPVASGTTNATMLPPGIGPGGITDTRAVTGATAAALANHSYRWVLTRRTTVDGQETESSRVVVTVNGPVVYAVSVRRPSGTESDETVIQGAYADGRTHIERSVEGGETTYCARPVLTSQSAAESYAARVEERLAWMLTARESALAGSTTRNGSTVYRVRLSSDRWSDIESQTGTALIDRAGVVHELRTTYTSSRSATRKTIVTEHYLTFGVAAVPPPPWYSVARAVTDPTTESC